MVRKTGAYVLKKNNKILNRAEFWQSKLEDCKTEKSLKKSNRYLRHIKRLGRLSLQIEYQKLKKNHLI